MIDSFSGDGRRHTRLSSLCPLCFRHVLAPSLSHTDARGRGRWAFKALSVYKAQTGSPLISLGFTSSFRSKLYFSRSPFCPLCSLYRSHTSVRTCTHAHTHTKTDKFDAVQSVKVGIRDASTVTKVDIHCKRILMGPIQMKYSMHFSNE